MDASEQVIHTHDGHALALVACDLCLWDSGNDRHEVGSDAPTHCICHCVDLLVRCPDLLAVKVEVALALQVVGERVVVVGLEQVIDLPLTLAHGDEVALLNEVGDGAVITEHLVPELLNALTEGDEDGLRGNPIVHAQGREDVRFGLLWVDGQDQGEHGLLQISSADGGEGHGHVVVSLVKFYRIRGQGSIPVADVPGAIGALVGRLPITEGGTDESTAGSLLTDAVHVGCHGRLTDGVVGGSVVDEESAVVLFDHVSSIKGQMGRSQAAVYTSSAVTRTQGIGLPTWGQRQMMHSSPITRARS